MTEPIVVSVNEAAKILGLGRTSLYAAISSGTLKTRHYGRRTLVEMESIRAFVAGLPNKKNAA